MLGSPKFLLAAVLLVLVLIIIVQNTEVVAVRFLLWEMHMSRVVLIVLALATGFACGFLAARLASGRRKGTG